MGVYDVYLLQRVNQGARKNEIPQPFKSAVNAAIRLPPGKSPRIVRNLVFSPQIVFFSVCEGLQSSEVEFIAVKRMV